MSEFFRRFSNKTSYLSGTMAAFGLAVLVILVWMVTGPLFAFSDTWQLVINTGTTVVTFLMVFLIQNTQNRDSIAIHTKLDELIVKTVGARNKLVEAQDLSDADIAALRKVFEAAARRGGTEAVPVETDTIERAAGAGNGSRSGRSRSAARRKKPAKSRN